MRNGAKFGTAKSSAGEWDGLAWDRAMARWVESVDAPGFGDRSGGGFGTAARSGASVAMSGFPAAIDLATLNGINGFRIDGINAGDNSGFSVSSAGDVNGDGFDDVIIGASGGDPGGDSAAGESYVVFGKADGFAASFNLSTLDGSNGFRIDGIDAYDESGYSVSSAGDVNGDGFDDIIVGAPYADPGGDSAAGESYIVFGKAGFFAASINLATLNGTNGFRIDGSDVNDQSGRSVSSTGDVNGDGFDDIIIGARYADPDGNDRAGESYVVFGKAGGFAASLDLATLNGSNGFRIDGIDVNDQSGRSVSAAGDLNGDGFDDIIIAARFADPGGDPSAGESYVVFGKAGGFVAGLDLATLNGSDGFRLDGVDTGDFSGSAVSAAGDVNSDGFDDLLISARFANPGGGSAAGESYVVFGKAGAFAPSLDLATLNGGNGFRIEGIVAGDQSGCSVSAAGDVNGDGFDDIIIGARYADPGGDSTAGESYVVFGKAGGFTASVDLAALDGTNGFRIDGIDAGDQSGCSVSAAGDVNGDGFDDIIIGAPFADPSFITTFNSGESYVIFGQKPTGDVTRIGSNIGQFISGGLGDDVIGGLGGNDILRGDVGDDELSGGSGADTLDGGADFDGLKGGSGDDFLGGGAGEDRLDGGSGTDTATYASASKGVRADISAPGSGNNDAHGDTYISIENLSGSNFKDNLGGSTIANRIDGLAGADTLSGEGGADTLAGGTGKDQLTGGAGADRFELASTAAGDADTISDFAGGADKIALDSDVFGLAEGTLPGGRFVIGTAAGDSSDRLIYNSANGQLFFDSDGTGAAAQVLIATLTGAPVIAATDFVVI